MSIWTRTARLTAEGSRTGWGDASGQKGYYIGSEKWFKANVYQITVRKSLLSDAQRALLDQEPLPMKLWDPLA